MVPPSSGTYGRSHPVAVDLRREGEPDVRCECLALYNLKCSPSVSARKAAARPLSINFYHGALERNRIRTVLRPIC